MHFNSIYRELVFFDGAAFAHCVAWEEHERLKHIKESALRAIASRR